MKKSLTCFALAFSLPALVAVTGCKSAEDESAAVAAPVPAEQTTAGAAPQQSPEAAKAAEDAIRRDKRGY